MPQIQFTERELEDYLFNDNALHDNLHIRPVARQVRTPNGVIDIVGINTVTNEWYVIELKKDILDASAFFQVEKYWHYMNMTKPRQFHKLIVGQRLHQDLHHAVSLYDMVDDTTSHFRTKYALFGMTFDDPISFSWRDTAQVAISKGEGYE